MAPKRTPKTPERIAKAKARRQSRAGKTTPAQRAAALLLLAQGERIRDVAKQLQIDPQKVRHWAAEAHQEPPDPDLFRATPHQRLDSAVIAAEEAFRAADAARRNRLTQAELEIAEKRASVKARMIVVLTDVLSRMDRPTIVYMVAGGEIEGIRMRRPPARDTHQLAVASGILLDKIRLEEGQVTQRTEAVGVGSVDAELEQLALEIRRKATSASSATSKNLDGLPGPGGQLPDDLKEPQMRPSTPGNAPPPEPSSHQLKPSDLRRSSEKNALKKPRTT